MSDLNEQEQSILDWLETNHKMTIEHFGKDYEADHIRIAKTNGNIPWKVMKVYCDNHKTDYPDWPDFVKNN